MSGLGRLLLGLLAGRARLRRRWDRWDWAALTIAGVIAAALFAYKLTAFFRLRYTSDLFESVQLATGWLDGKPLLVDNCFDDQLNTHTYFLLLPLGFLARPFGAPGLLFVLSVSAGVVVFFAVRILRTLGVAAPVAIVFALLLILSPYAIAFYDSAPYGFNIELLAPALSLFLVFALLQRRMVLSLVAALLLICIKEEAPVLVGLLGLSVFVEDLLGRRDRRLNRPAMATMILAAVAFPLLLHIIKSHPTTGYAAGSFGRLLTARNAGVDSSDSLARFVFDHRDEWLASDTVAKWRRSVEAASFGLSWLRPHLFVLGLPLSLVAWLMRDDLLWAPRFAFTLSFSWCLSLLGFASLWRLVSRLPESGAAWRLAARALVALGWLSLAESLFSDQLTDVPIARSVYRSEYVFGYTPSEWGQADHLFAIYRARSRRDEPAAASPYLFRYVHDRNLLWLDRLNGHPRPHWILADGTYRGAGAYGLMSSDYELVSRAGQFALYRQKSH